MKKSKTKDLILKSVLHTSDVFTKELMERIELKKSRAKAFHNAIITACVICMILLLVIIRMPSDVSLFDLKIKLPSLMLKVTGVIFVFTLLNKLLSLRSELN